LNISRILAVVLEPYLPASAEQIARFLRLERVPEWTDLSFSLRKIEIGKPEILFKKLEKKEIERVKSIVTRSTDAQDYFR
jgi:methionyl-tRNA synthetase